MNLVYMSEMQLMVPLAQLCCLLVLLIFMPFHASIYSLEHKRIDSANLDVKLEHDIISN
jgi:hypothetical protein